jgi:hypothetical protein
MRVFWKLLCCVVVLQATNTVAVAVAQTVTAVDGNIYYVPHSGTDRKQLTTTGLDSQPKLSPDRSTVVFVRATPSQIVRAAYPNIEATELWTIRVDGNDSRLRVRGKAADAIEETIAGIESPEFSPDGSQIYFLTVGWVTSSAVRVVDLSSGRVRFLCPGNSLEVIHNGQYHGHLILGQHRYFMGGGSYDWLWLVSPDGREVGPIGDADSADISERLKYVRGEKLR